MDCLTALVSCPTVSARSPRSAVVAPRSSAGCCCCGLMATHPRGSVRGILSPGQGGHSGDPCFALPGCPWTRLGATRLSWHPGTVNPQERHGTDGFLLGHVLSCDQLQTGVLELASQLGGAPASPPHPSTFGLRELLHLPHPPSQGQRLTRLCRSVCDCRLRAWRDWSRHRGSREGRVPHRDRYAPFQQPQSGGLARAQWGDQAPWSL